MSQHHDLPIVATATRRGRRRFNCDAVSTFTASDATTAVAVLDGTGNSRELAEAMERLAWVAARVAAQRGGLAGIMAAASVIADPGTSGAAPDGVAVIAVRHPDDTDTAITWTGDARAYGWNGTRLRQYSTDHTVGQHLRLNGMPVEVAEDHDNWLRVSLANSTVGTVYQAAIPGDELVLLTSDGVHDSVPEPVLLDLLRTLYLAPQMLANAVVDAAEPDPDTGYRDDATAAVLR
ncbi:hypothetical protein [Actinomadura atramentaria]|uniref:hypothetical protein n=1 Tax=Actinomadura atramentaria TaxID=1990 RepID=UPI00037835A6|nr:hypothetical protein [Actinomadura atramentaria]